MSATDLPTLPASAAPGWALWSSTMRKKPYLLQLGAYTSAVEAKEALSLTHHFAQLPQKTQLHLFKAGIRPLWEEPQNAKGGHLKISTCSHDHSKAVWSRVTESFVDGTFPANESLNGVTIMVNRDNLIKVWLAIDHVAVVQQVRAFLKGILDPQDFKAHVGFVYHRVTVKGASRKLPKGDQSVLLGFSPRPDDKAAAGGDGAPAYPSSCDGESSEAGLSSHDTSSDCDEGAPEQPEQISDQHSAPSHHTPTPNGPTSGIYHLHYVHNPYSLHAPYMYSIPNVPWLAGEPCDDTGNR